MGFIPPCGRAVSLLLARGPKVSFAGGSWAPWGPCAPLGFASLASPWRWAGSRSGGAPASPPSPPARFGLAAGGGTALPPLAAFALHSRPSLRLGLREGGSHQRGAGASMRGASALRLRFASPRLRAPHPLASLAFRPRAPLVSVFFRLARGRPLRGLGPSARTAFAGGGHAPACGRQPSPAPLGGWQAPLRCAPLSSGRQPLVYSLPKAFNFLAVSL